MKLAKLDTQGPYARNAICGIGEEMGNTAKQLIIIVWSVVDFRLFTLKQQFISFGFS